MCIFFPHFLGQTLDCNSQIWLKFECNGTKKPLTEIRKASFYLHRYGILSLLGRIGSSIFKGQNMEGDNFQNYGEKDQCIYL